MIELLKQLENNITYLKCGEQTHLEMKMKEKYMNSCGGFNNEY